MIKCTGNQVGIIPIELELKLELLLFDFDPDFDLDDAVFDFHGVDRGFLLVEFAAAFSLRVPLDERLPLEVVEPFRNDLGLPWLLSF